LRGKSSPSRACEFGGLTVRLRVRLVTLRIRRDLLDEVIAHAHRDHPDEACGVIAGPTGSDEPRRFIPMVNAARSPTFYEFDSADLLALYRQMDDNDEEAVVIYHSHTATPAYPSRTDINLASEPNAHYLLVSTRESALNPGSEPEVRCFRIVDAVVTEEPVEVLTS
jgi:[CysO sulfur-carrier protein]-S-L-cysteine hydrolase